MIDLALEFLTQQVNDYLNLKNLPVSGTVPEIVLTNVAAEDGNWAIPPRTLGLSLINIEEDRVNMDQTTTHRNMNGDVEHYNPEIKLNLYILVSANFASGDAGGSTGTTGVYSEGLKQLSYVISFFQGKYVFTTDNSPMLDPSIKKLIVELYSSSFEQQYNFWTVVGAKYLPSVLYRVRMLVYQEHRVLDQQVPVTNIDLQTTGN
ncbi:MAG TPA: DUF4255 domain-containing protein [Bacteroidia bacterium]|nr:DUF4255 domain-containing protein [Bacteroidia bacterium]